MDLGRGGVCLRRDLYKDDFAELNVVGVQLLLCWYRPMRCLGDCVAVFQNQPVSCSLLTR
jgi:hypothetical protein